MDDFEQTLGDVSAVSPSAGGAAPPRKPWTDRAVERFTTTTATPYKIADLSGVWDAEDTPVVHVDKYGVIPEGSVCLVGGSWGSGKSRLLLAMMRDAFNATGRSMLYLDLENSRQSIIQMRKQLDVPRSPDFVWWSMVTRRTVDGKLQYEPPADPDSPAVLEWCASKKNPLVVIDSLGVFLARKAMSENKTEDVNPQFTRWNKAMLRCDATVAWIHHLNKSGGLRGSEAIPGGVDQVYSISSAKRDDGGIDSVTVRMLKGRISLFQETLLKYDDGRFTVDAQQLDKQRTLADKLTSILRDNPDGISVGDFEKEAHKAGVSRFDAIKWRKAMRGYGVVERETTSAKGRANLVFLDETQLDSQTDIPF